MSTLNDFVNSFETGVGAIPHLLSQWTGIGKSDAPADQFAKSTGVAKAQDQFLNSERNQGIISSTPTPSQTRGDIGADVGAVAKDRNGNPIAIPTLPDQTDIRVGAPVRTVATQEEFNRIAAPILKDSGIPLAVSMAQRAAESRDMNGLGARRNNFYNIGAYDSNPNNAVSYATPEDGVRAYVKLIKNKFPEVLSAKTPEEALKIIEQKGYAGDPSTYEHRAKNNYKSYSQFVMDTPEWRQYQNQ